MPRSISVAVTFGFIVAIVFTSPKLVEAQITAPGGYFPFAVLYARTNA